MTDSLRHHTLPSLARSSKKMSSVERQAAVLQLRDAVLSKIRDDWTFPVNDQLGGDPERKLDQNEAVLANKVANHDNNTSMQWVEREYSSSSSDTDAIDKVTSRTLRESRRTSPQAQYTFDNPDSVGLTVKLQKREKRLQRRLDFEEELAWNDGLSHWQRQRDAWTGGRSRQVAFDDTNTHTLQTLTLHSHELKEAKNDTAPALDFSGLYDTIEEVRLVPPIMPINSPRPKISPSTYPQIYNKVVTRSLTPTLPLNLKDVTAAIVQGWKTDGQWPPTASTPEPGFARRRQRSKKAGDIVEPDSPRHPHFNKGVGVVKKVLGLGSSEVES